MSDASETRRPPPPQRRPPPPPPSSIHRPSSPPPSSSQQPPPLPSSYIPPENRHNVEDQYSSDNDNDNNNNSSSNNNEGPTLEYYLRQALSVRDYSLIKETLAKILLHQSSSPSPYRFNGDLLANAESAVRDNESDHLANEISTLRPYLKQGIDNKKMDMLRIALEKADKISANVSSTNRRLYSDFFIQVDEGKKLLIEMEKENFQTYIAFLKQGLQMRSREILKETLEKINTNYAINTSSSSSSSSPTSTTYNSNSNNSKSSSVVITSEHRELVQQATSVLQELDCHALIKFYIKQAMEQKDETALDGALEQAFKLKMTNEKEYIDGTKLLQELKSKGKGKNLLLPLALSSGKWWGLGKSSGDKEKNELKSPTSSDKRLFGAPLLEILNRPLETIDGIPSIIVQCCDYLRSTALHEPGLFRVAGNKDNMMILQRQFEQQADDIKLSDIHDTSGLLKLFIRNLPEPLIPFDFYDRFIKAGTMKSDESARDTMIKEALNELPKENRHILHYLIRFLREVSSHKEMNKMTPENLAIVFAPNLLKPKIETAQSMITDTSASIAAIAALIASYQQFFHDDTAAASSPIVSDHQRSPSSTLSDNAHHWSPPSSAPITRHNSLASDQLAARAIAAAAEGNDFLWSSPRHQNDPIPIEDESHHQESESSGNIQSPIPSLRIIADNEPHPMP